MDMDNFVGMAEEGEEEEEEEEEPQRKRGHLEVRHFSQHLVMLS